MILGYIRVAADDQDLVQQRESLRAAGCEQVFEEPRGSGSKPQTALATLIGKIQPDDLVVVTSLFQLARSTADLLKAADHLKSAGAGLQSLAEPWANTTLPAGWMVFAVLSGITQFEQNLTARRTTAGRIDAKTRGVRFGRPPSLAPDQIALGRELIKQGTSVRRAAAVIGCHYASLYRALTPKDAGSRQDP